MLQATDCRIFNYFSLVFYFHFQTAFLTQQGSVVDMVTHYPGEHFEKPTTSVWGLSQPKKNQKGTWSWFWPKENQWKGRERFDPRKTIEQKTMGKGYFRRLLHLLIRLKGKAQHWSFSSHCWSPEAAETRSHRGRCLWGQMSWKKKSFLIGLRMSVESNCSCKNRLFDEVWSNYCQFDIAIHSFRSGQTRRRVFLQEKPMEGVLVRFITSLFMDLNMFH